jgi:hypothetical protein
MISPIPGANTSIRRDRAVVVVHPFRADDPFESADQALLDALVEEGDIKEAGRS